MTELFMYNISGKKAIAIKNICRALNIQTREISPEEYGTALGSLLGISETESRAAAESFSDEMLYLIGFSDGLLSIFLKLLRSKKCTVALKAVATETNLEYNSYELFKEISAEHKAMQSGEAYHQA